MTIKQKIEDNLTLVVMGFVATGFIAGFGSYKVIQEIAGPNKPISGDAWIPAAREANWIPKIECPAYPVHVNINSPGSGATPQVSKTTGTLPISLVVQTSRPLPRSSSVGIIMKEEGDQNHFLLFPFSDGTSSSRQVFRTDGISLFKVHLPRTNSSVDLWAVVVDDKSRFGIVYSSLDQIIGSGDVTVSSKTRLMINWY